MAPSTPRPETRAPTTRGAAITAAEHGEREERGQPQSPLRTIVAGLSWNLVSLVATTATFVLLTPFLLLHLGVERYGVFSFVSVVRGLLSNLDGGLGPCADQFFAMYAGSGDRRRTASFLLTVSLLVTPVVCGVAALGFVFAPQLMSAMHTSPVLRGEATALLRAYMPLLVVGALRSMLGRVIQARHAWRYANVSATLASLLFAATAAILVALGRGLMGLFWSSVVLESTMFLLYAIGAGRLIRLSDLRLVPKDELKQVLRYSIRVQYAEIASSLGNEVNALAVGLLFPVRYVAYYGIGTNFASSLAGLPMNAYLPVAVTLGRTFGKEGLAATVREFAQLQRLWVRAFAAYPLIGAVAAILAVPRWLGPGEHAAGWIASISLVGMLPGTLSSVMAALGKAVNRPELESRYLASGLVVSLTVLVPLARAVGILGVPLAALLGQWASNAYLIRISRRIIQPQLRSYLAEVPLLAIVFGVAVTTLLEVLLSPVAPRGPVGLVISALPALLGLLAYASVLGDGRALLARARRRDLRSLLSTSRGATSEPPSVAQASRAAAEAHAVGKTVDLS
jgi:O-antigen/teichoic acid export membrane protein